MTGGRSRVDSLVEWMALAVAATVALALPAGHFALSYQHQVASLQTEAAVYAWQVTKAVNANPELWRFQEHLLQDILGQRLGSVPETKQILDDRQALVVEYRRALEAPTHTETHEILDSGNMVGRIAVSRSLRPILLHTAATGLLGLFLGALVYIALRTYPLKALDQALKSLAEEKERAQVTLHSIADGVIATDTEQNVILVNKVAERLTGWSAAEALGQPVGEVFQSLEEATGAPAKDLVGKVLERRAPSGPQPPSTLVGRNGEKRLISESAAPISDAGGHVMGVVLVFRDITEIHRLEEELIRAQKLESIGLLAGGIAHDFNNVLTAILGNISVAGLHSAQNEAVAARLASAEKACQRARFLTNQLLTFSKGGAPVKRVIDIRKLLREAAAFALTGSNTTCRFSLPDTLWPLDVDEGQMAQVIDNLLINADQAMPDGGVITVSAENLTVSGPNALPLPDGRYVMLSFADRGGGIRAENLGRIFDPYFTTKKSGTGLGLATTYSIVKRHGGHISVESEVGVGTTFRVYLAASEGRAPEGDFVDGQACPGRGKILLMDDEEAIREISAEILVGLGYAVETAPDGEQAVRLYKEAARSGAGFDAVILDLTVPGGMGGKAAAEELLVFDSGVKAIVSSGYHHDSIVAEYGKHGFSGALSKPYKIEELALLLRQVIGEKPTAGRSEARPR